MDDGVLDTAMRTYYARRAPEYDDWYDRLGRYDNPATNARWHAEVGMLERAAEDFGSGVLLDIACGTGRWTATFARGAAITSVTALDRAPEMLRETRERLQRAGVTATLVEGDAYTLPFADSSFDACFFGFFLSHVPPARAPRFLGEVRRVLRRPGRVLVFDSLLTGDKQPEEIQRRPLKDGSLHDVLKVYYSVQSLGTVLASTFASADCDVRSTGSFFVIGHAGLP